MPHAFVIERICLHQVKEPMNHFYSRRELLQKAGLGFGSLAFYGMMQGQNLFADDINPLATQAPARKKKAKSIIWLYMNGGQSHVDTWDYKPELAKRDGVALEGFDNTTGFFKDQVGPLMKSPWEFKQYGQSGKWVSDLFPHLSTQVDKMSFVHSCFSKSNNHAPALFTMNSGEPRMGYPCVGSWVTYGLGAINQNLPAFVVMADPLNRGLPKGHALNWSAGFLPGAFQGTYLKPKGTPIDNLKRAASMTGQQQRDYLDLLSKLNHKHMNANPEEKQLAARIESFELAYRMQTTAPEAFDLTKESSHIQKLYGLDNKKCQHFAKQCLTARRLVERGTRFIQIYSGGMENSRSWDGHVDIVKNHGGFAAETDQPIAALIQDLEQRGLLEETLIVCCGEFGRLPIVQRKPGAKNAGRDHNPHAFTTWFCGGGVKPGVSYGATDEIGFKAAENKVSVHKLHATMLELMGIDHKKLAVKHNGLDTRLTGVKEVEAIKEIMA